MRETCATERSDDDGEIFSVVVQQRADGLFVDLLSSACLVRDRLFRIESHGIDSNAQKGDSPASDEAGELLTPQTEETRATERQTR